MRGALIAALLVALTMLPQPADAAAVGIVRIRADGISYYNNLGLIAASGSVQLDLGTGTEVSGASLIMDVRNGRVVVAGGVVVRSPHATYDGAALADDLLGDRGYLLAFEPDVRRIAFTTSALETVDPNATIPPDAFAWPDVRDTPASTLSRRMTAQANVYVRFSGCRAQILGGFRLYFPLPVCYTNFGADPNLFQNSLSGANIGAGYRFAGNANASSSAVINYDQTQHLYAALQQNVSSQHGWAVASINPLGGRNPTISAIAETGGGGFSLRSSVQLHEVDAPSLDAPFGSSQYTDVLATGGFRGGYAALYYQFGNQKTEAPAQQLGVLPPKPTNLQFSFTSADLPIGRDAVIGNVQAGFGFAHDPTGLAIIADTLWTTDAFQYVGAALRAPSIALGAGWSLNLAIVGQREWQSIPHVIDQVTSSAGLTRRIDERWAATAAYSVANVADNYGSLQRAAYPVYAPPSDPGYAAFDGFATFRTLSIGAFFTPRADFDLSAVLSQHTDFPRAVPGLFPQLPTPALGQNLPPYALGEAPYDLALAARVRLNPQLSLLVQDTYSFNFGGQTWTSFNFQLLP